VRHHVSAETLALHRDGAVSASEAASIAAHLATCERCSAIDAQLAGLPRLLGAAPPPPMPPEVLVRLQMAIASESAARGAAGLAPAAGAAGASAQDATTTALNAAPDVVRADGTLPGGADGSAAGAVTGGGGRWRRRGAGAGVPQWAAESTPAQIPGRPDLPERPRRQRFPWLRMPEWSSPLVLRGLAAAGALVVIVGVGMMLANGRIASSQSGAGAPRVHPPALRRTATGGYLSHRPLAAGQVGVSYRLNGRVATTTALVSNDNFTRKSLPGEVRRDVTSFPAMGNASGGAANPTTESPVHLPGGFGIPQVEGCLNTVASGRMVLVTEIARYLGTPAAIIVLRSTHAGVFDVVVAGFACSAGNPAIIAALTVPAG
jgi:hypothetical protein